MTNRLALKAPYQGGVLDEHRWDHHPQLYTRAEGLVKCKSPCSYAGGRQNPKHTLHVYTLLWEGP